MSTGADSSTEIREFIGLRRVKGLRELDILSFISFCFESFLVRGRE